MQKSSLPVGVKTLLKYQESGTLEFDNPVQRQQGQWNNLQQSMLIHSILGDFIIPNLYFKKESKEGTNFLSVLDGLQRLSTVFAFIRDEWSLHAKTPKVVVDGIEYDIALKTFSELEEDLKADILGYRFTTYQLENCTDEEIEETFARLNAGTPLSKIQQARPKMGIQLADWCNKLVAQDFFQKSLNMTVAQLRREDDFLMLVTVMMLLDSRYDNGFSIKTSASAAECVRFAEHIKNNYSQEKKDDIELLVEYLNETFHGTEYKFLKKNNIPIIMYNAQIAIEHGIAETEFLNAVVEFYDSGCSEAYNEASGSGNVKMVNVNVRLKELLSYIMQELPQYFQDEVTSGVSSEQVEQSDPETDNEDDAENSEDNGDEPTSDNSSEDSSENTEEVNDKHYVLFKLSTNNVGQESEDVYEVDNVEEDYLNSLGHDLASDNADSYGVVKDDTFEEEPFSYTWEVLDKTREEIEEEYGEVLNV